MIPPFAGTSTRSPGEREIFRRLKDDPATSNWIVLHSLDIAQHTRQVEGELDFVIVMPEKGVLCVEVKAHRKIERSDEGLWYLGTSDKGESRGPFKQASEGMHSARQNLLERAKRAQLPSQVMGRLSRIVFWSAVVFPYVRFKVESPEWHPWQVIDSTSFSSISLGRAFSQILDNAHTHLAHTPTATWFRPGKTGPDAAESDLVATLLRPSFEFYESPDSRANRISGEIKHYTTGQFHALSAMGSNPRVAFYGPAGTGKTTLAIEAARRGVAAGRRVLFVCYNRLLGRKLEEETRGLGSQVVTRTLHSHMLAVSGQEAGKGSGYWEEELPQLATTALLTKILDGQEENLSFDELVVDEAQDILRDSYLDFLDLSLKGGLAAGQWRFFGDFEKQAIYGASNLSLEAFLSTRGGNAPRYALRVNCRNTPRVAGVVPLLCGLEPPYDEVLRPDDGVKPSYLFYASAAEQEERLVQVLEQLYREGYKPQDIRILSPLAGDRSGASHVTQLPWSQRLRPLERVTGGHIGYTSIHAFKGLEAPVIIITDIERLTDRDQSMALFYIGVTRALHRLVILMHERAKADVFELLGTG